MPKVFQASEVLREAITTGDIPAGSYSARRVAGKLNISLGPVREALRILSMDGLVVLHPRQHFEVPCRSSAEIRSIFDLRRKIEPLLAVDQVRDRTKTDLVVVKTLLRLNVNKRDHVLNHRRIHEALLLDAEYSSVKSRCAVSLIRASWRYLYGPMRAIIATSSACPLDSSHFTLIEEIRNGSPESVRMAAHEHLDEELRVLRLPLT